ncbi:MAG: cytochrome-c oxidase, cbb3-type subunit III [Gammaproteobacteria bacterium HGW-Gammaproteobacteria-6]|nr:MAG: cytochrome-c oxidase, cbb3-type subunit III [Gammaproteobacteria bacterium HGW-Gammaproteobacteria-6]PKM15675.1 MAG: cytochrome-c oxidase, cbb3-type subunit III [Gammaproteobacteria bacterium HGW-Gammaproteobacteria-2]
MSSAWSWYVMILVVLNIGGCALLLWWTARRRGGESTSGTAGTTGHVWDGDLREYTKPMPRWWIIWFYLTIVFAIAYLVWYPGFGNFAGSSGWTAAKEHDAAVALAQEKLAPLFARFDGQPIDRIATDPEGLALGKSIFANNCAACHGSDARGAKGFPNLVDDDWQWGGSPDDILATVLNGRQAAMPPMGAALGGDEVVTQVAVYVQSLSGQKVDPGMAAAGKPKFELLCAACHTPAGTGNPLLGAPNLTDTIWLYGSDFNTIRDGIVNGHAGQMPAHLPLIGETRVRLAAAWVYAQSHPSNDSAKNP